MTIQWGTRVLCPDVKCQKKHFLCVERLDGADQTLYFECPETKRYQAVPASNFIFVCLDNEKNKNFSNAIDVRFSDPALDLPEENPNELYDSVTTRSYSEDLASILGWGQDSDMGASDWLDTQLPDPE